MCEKPKCCLGCPLLFCDIISPDCRLKASEVPRLRPDLIKPLTASQTHYRRYRSYYKVAAKAWRERNPDRRRGIQRNQWAKHKDAINARRREKRLSCKNRKDVMELVKLARQVQAGG